MVDDLLEKYKDARDTFLTSALKFPKDKRELKLFDKKSLKDILGFITFWERLSIEEAEAIQNGTLPALDNKKLERKLTKRNKNSTCDQIYQDLIQSGKEIILLYSSLTRDLSEKLTSNYQGEYLQKIEKFLKGG